jgi:hypothetical protein
MVKSGLIDEKFVYDVISVDMPRPGFRLIFPTMGMIQKNQQQIAYGGRAGAVLAQTRHGDG